MGRFRREADSFFRIMAAALAAMGLILWTATAFISFGTPEAESGDGSFYLPGAQERLNLLVVGREGDHIDLCLLLGFLPDKGMIALAAIPPMTLLPSPGGDTTPAAAVLSGGARQAGDLLSDWLDIPIDRVAEVEYDGFSAMMAAGGPVDFELTLDLDAELRGRRIKMNRGTVALTGRSAADLMLYPAYPRGESQRSDMTVQLLRAVLAHHLTGVLTDTGGRLYSLCLNNMESDLSYLDYEQRRDAAQFLARLEKTPVTMVFLDGSRSGSYYYLTNAAQARIRTVFGADEGESSVTAAG